jgi:signal transduction histidine kinase
MLLLAAARVVLALGGLVVIWTTPAEPARLIAITSGSLVAYLVYGIAIATLVTLAPAALPARILPWVDVLFAAFVVALTEGTNSIFFFLFFFSILSAAFTSGFREGIALTLASVVLYVVASVIGRPLGVEVETDRVLIRPVYLAALGFLVSYWGGSELELKRRLALLGEVAAGVHVGDGVHATIDATLRRLRHYFGADAAMLALNDDRVNGGVLHSVSAAVPDQPLGPMDVSHETLDLFLAVPGDRSHAAAAWPRPHWAQRLLPLGTPSRIMTAGGRTDPAVPALANVVETNNIAVAPYFQTKGIEGRLVLARSSRRFNHGEAAFLAQCGRAMASVVENARLAEELVSQAARYERVSVSRDLHDTTIQPYIGLRMAIEGVLRDFRDDERVTARLSRLLEMTDLGIRELRDYTMRLKTGASIEGRLFHAAIEHQVERLSRYYGIAVNVDADVSVRLAARIEEAILQIIAEALSNMNRHAKCRCGRISLRSDGSQCRLEIENEHGGGGAPRPFVPKSIDERVRDLGGRLVVDPSREGSTVLTILLPQSLAT